MASATETMTTAERMDGGCKRTSPFRRTERSFDQWRAVPTPRSDQVVFGLAKDLQSRKISLRHLCAIPYTSQCILSLKQQLACPWFSRSLFSFPSFLRPFSFPRRTRFFFEPSCLFYILSCALSKYASAPLTPAQRRPCQTSLMLPPAAALRPRTSPTSIPTTPTTTTSTAVAIRHQRHKGSRAARMADNRQRG